MEVPLERQGGKEVRRKGKERGKDAQAFRPAPGISIDDELELSKDRVAYRLTEVKDNYVVIRMDVSAGTQWGASWSRERVCGRGAIRKNCGNLWKSKARTLENHKGVAPKIVLARHVCTTRPVYQDPKL